MIIVRDKSLDHEAFLQDSFPESCFSDKEKESSTKKRKPGKLADLGTETRLKESSYNVKKEFSSGCVIVSNTLFDSVVILDSKEADVLEKPHKSDVDLVYKLYLLGILKDEGLDETEIAISYSKTIDKNGVYNVTVLPTQECNARCGYCFAEHNEQISMKHDVVESVIDFFSNNFSNDDEVVIRWFGGEPLVRTDIIDYITRGINMRFNNQLSFRSILFTNGSLLNDSLIEHSKKAWNLEKTQLTIDGYESEHNNRKNYVNSAKEGINYYKKVISDIKTLLINNIAVDCRINLDKRNIEQLDYILKDLSPYKEDDIFRVRVTILRPTDCGYNGFDYIEPKDYRWAYDIIYEKLIHYGFLRDIRDIIPKRLRESCILKNDKKVIIGADGNLYKCLQKSLSENLSICDLKSVSSFAKSNSNRETITHNVCTSCCFFPQCFGGCEAYWDLSNTTGITPCKRERYFYDMILDKVYNWYCT